MEIPSIPIIGTRYLDYLTDTFSIWQHSSGNMIDRKMGYALDDAARGLVLAMQLGREDLIEIYYKFISKSCLTDPPTVFYSSAREPLPGPLSADAAGQVVWAAGLAQHKGYELPGFKDLARQLTDRILTWPSIRGWAYALMGMMYIDPEKSVLLGKKIIEQIDDFATDDWYWPEDTITYGNAIIPNALIQAGFILTNKEWVVTGFRLLDFLNSIQYVGGKPTTVGNKGWYVKGKEMAHFDQQPIEAAYLVLANVTAYERTGNEEYLNHALQFLSWFWGNNLPGLPVVNASRESVYDGLWEKETSMNQGAESIVCYLLAQEAVKPYLTSSVRS